MLKITLAGRVGKDGEHRTTQGGIDICSFTVACDVGFGDNKDTIWVDVAKFGKGAAGLARYVRKGSPITVVGDMTTREHNGKTYINCRADEVVLQGSKGDARGEQRKPYDEQSQGGSSGGWGGGNSGGGSDYSDLDSDIPF